MLLQDVKWLQVENTTRCNAWCPACGRNQGGYGLVPDLVVQDLDLQRFQQVLEQFPNLETIQFCGTYGDTMAAQNVLEHVSLAKNHCKKIQIHTHGGIRNEHWWSEFAVLLKDIDHDVWFALDGLKGVHEIYRQGTDFDKTIANARSFISGGGHATWQFIPWAHNEHQIKDCMQLSQQLGFKKFKFVFSVRKEFQGRHWQTGQPIEFRPWGQDSVLNPLNQKKIYLEEKNCHHLTQSSLYLNANGSLNVCCYYNTYQSKDQVNQLHNIRQLNALSDVPSNCIKWCGSA
jgi:sulfatase maturation enzyme AslB (radical SAM superfamily)